MRDWSTMFLSCQSYNQVHPVKLTIHLRRHVCSSVVLLLLYPIMMSWTVTRDTVRHAAMTCDTLCS